jgi:hypothetical protein
MPIPVASPEPRVRVENPWFPQRRSTLGCEPLLAFYDFPAEHWIHLKTTNLISVNRLWEACVAGAA